MSEENVNIDNEASGPLKFRSIVGEGDELITEMNGDSGSLSHEGEGGIPKAPQRLKNTNRHLSRKRAEARRRELFDSPALPKTSIEDLSREFGEDEGKWECMACTFHNSSSSRQCFQCDGPKPLNAINMRHSSPSGDCCSGYDLEADFQPLRISELEADSPQFQRHRVTFDKGPEDEYGKWTCQVCTYDNWPRSGKCVMCRTARVEGNPNNGPNNRNAGNEKNLSLNGSPVIEEASGFQRSPDQPRDYRVRLFRREADVRWLDACRGVVDGNIEPVEEYLAAGGDPARQLTQTEVLALDRSSAFDVGFTLVHLALRFHQQNLLATLLSQVDGGPTRVKRVPSYAAPNIATEIRRHALGSLRQRKGNFRCKFTSENVTFTLPTDIEDLPGEIQETLFNEILDRDVQKELESGKIINWSVEVSEGLTSRLYPLWNRSAGDCLLDSVFQATWGIFDRENGLRMSLSDSLHDCSAMFYQRWKENELLLARLLNFSLNDSQVATDWAKLLSIAGQPGASLEQLHIFALTHILRRPIIVYGVKYVKSFRGETLGYARYEGVYLPFLWEPSFCWKWPIVLGYTRGHFSALVAFEPDCDPLMVPAASNTTDPDENNYRAIYLPLQTISGSLLPIHFLSQSEGGKEEAILNQWLEVNYTESGLMVARQRIQKRPTLVGQMVDEWLNHYKNQCQISPPTYIRQQGAACYSSDGDSEND